MIGILIFLLIVVVIYGIVTGPATVQEVRGNRHQLFENLHFSAQQFYQSVEQEACTKEINGISFSRITYAEAGLFSARREYLRIKRREYVFDICAAPYGKGTYVSWWIGEIETAPLRKYLIRIPVIGPLFVKRNKTYFELDNEAMFKELVIGVLNKVISQFTEVKGIRPLQSGSPTMEPQLL